ncbi:hypothetical protein DL98DRAFT_659316 [Cadophora sp. DSE1049]|nr:hypothetical protein DL98DRAFT_659316 [Cadophora sp. DSE1049]
MPHGMDSTVEIPTVFGRNNNGDVHDEDEDGTWEPDDDDDSMLNVNPQAEDKHSDFHYPNSWDTANMQVANCEGLRASNERDDLDEFVGVPTSMTDFHDHARPELQPPLGFGLDAISRPVQRSGLLGFLGRFGSSNFFKPACLTNSTISRTISSGVSNIANWPPISCAVHQTTFATVSTYRLGIISVSLPKTLSPVSTAIYSFSLYYYASHAQYASSKAQSVQHHQNNVSRSR